MKRFGFLLLVPGISIFLSACNDASGGAVSAEDNSAYSLQVLTAEVDRPWGITWLPQGDMLITSRQGTLHRLKANDQLVSISGVPEVHVNGQGGLLDIALPPDYERSGWVYLTYASSAGASSGSNTTVARARLAGNALVDLEIIYKAEPDTTKGQHYGSRMAFDGDGNLYFSIGDRGARDENPQDLSRDGGKIYRLAPDGSIPPTNPFVGRSDALPAVYSYGHRNPQGMAVHPQTGQVWIHEHGPRGGDEVNIIKAGANYGWPVLSYGVNYSGTQFAEAQIREGYESPVHHWTPSIAPSGMTFVTSDKYPQWQGYLLVGSLKFAYVELCQLEGDQITATTRLFEDIGRVRDVKQGPDGYLYVVTENKGIVRVMP